MKILFVSNLPAFDSIDGASVTTAHFGGGGEQNEIPNFGSALARWKLMRNISKSRLGNYDVMIVEAAGGSYSGGVVRRTVKMIYEQLSMRVLLRCSRKIGAKLVIWDIVDDLTIHPANRFYLDHCALYLKRELAIDRWRSLEALFGGANRTYTIGFRSDPRHDGWMKKLQPLSLGLGLTEDEALELDAEWGEPGFADKRSDVFYAGDGWLRPLRTQLQREIDSGDAKGLSLAVSGKRLSFAEFAREIRGAWLCLSPPGLGWDCYRHYEAGLFGAVPVLSRADITPFCPFVHGVDAIYYDPDLPVFAQLSPWLEDKARLLEMARGARKRVIAHHTRPARTAALVKALGKEESGG